MATDILDKIKAAFRNLAGEDEQTDSSVSTKSSEPLIAALRELDSAYREKKTNVDLSDPTEQYPETLGLEPKKYVEKSDEQIKSEAETLASAKNEKALLKAEERYTAATNKSQESTQEIEATEQADYVKLAKEASETLAKHRDDMVFQGLVNSSINTYGQKEIEEQYANEYKRIESEYDAKYLKIKNELSEAEQIYANAVRAYDLSYAADVRDAIDNLKQKELRRVAEINEYNRQIAEKEAKYQAQRAKDLQTLRLERTEALLNEIAAEAEYEDKNGVSAEKQAEYDKRLDVARSYYGGFSKTDANLMVYKAQSELVALLGKENYIKLVTEIMGRKS